MQKKGRESARFIDRVGERYKNNQGSWFTIIRYSNSFDCDVLFDNGYFLNNLQYQNVKRGNVKNMTYPYIYSLGYEGIGKYSQVTHTDSYKKWSGMFKRCYNELELSKHPSYRDCFVSEEWYNFQNFAKWFEDNFREGFELDKDILVKGNKIYSPETCCFVPQEVNKLIIKCDRVRGVYPIGVQPNSNGFRACCRVKDRNKYLGTFKTPEEAFKAYKIAKEDEIKRVADKWKGRIAKQVYKTLFNWKIEITD